jgi:hypothetical protein
MQLGTAMGAPPPPAYPQTYPLRTIGQLPPWHIDGGGGGGDDNEDDDEDDEFETDPEVSYLYENRGSLSASSSLPYSSSTASYPPSSSAPTSSSSSVVSDVIFADRARIIRKDKNAGGEWTLKLGSGCARLSGREYRVLKWTLKVRTGF